MLRLSPNNRPTFPTGNSESHKQNIGSTIPPTPWKHPNMTGYQTPLKIVSCKAYDLEGNLVGTLEDGIFRPLEH